MKKIALLFLFFITQQNIFAQKINNEWIIDGQEYLKIPVVENGFYKITIADISKVLPKILQAQISQLEIFHQGRKIAFEYQSLDNKIDENDWIYFYGMKNDGSLETELYRPTTAQPHKYYSLFSDQSVYFLSINTKQSEYKKISKEKIDTNVEIRNIESQNFVNTTVYSSDFSFNSITGPIPFIQNSFFESGETFTGPMIRSNTEYKIQNDLEGILNKNVQVEIMLNGRDNNTREIKISTENFDTTITLSRFSHKTILFNTFIKDINSKKIDISLFSADDRYSVNYIKVRFLKEIHMNNESGQFFIENGKNAKLVVSKKTDSNYRLFNISDPFSVYEAEQELNTNNYFINSKTENNIYYYFKEAKTISNFTLYKPETAKFSNTSNYLIISNKKLKDSSREYADFRRSGNGGNFDVELVYVEDLYDQFNFGIKSPLSIKNYLRYKLQNANPKYLLLIGKAFSAYTGRNDSTDLVPSIGYPASDALLSAGINGHIDIPALATGRIPALSNHEVLTYLNKVKHNLQLEPDLGRKNVIHLNGGKTFSEIKSFRSFMDSYINLVKDSDLGVSFFSKSKESLDPKESANIVSKLSEGVSLVSFLGHSNYQAVDLDIGFASDPLQGYNNNRYPVLFFNGCAFTNYFREIPTLSQDWIFAENKGAIASIGQSYFGFLTGMDTFFQDFYKNIFLSEFEPSIGEAMKMAAQQVVDRGEYGLYEVLNNNQTLLFGDPAIKIFGYNKPDFFTNNLQILNPNDTKQINLKFEILNTGTLSKSDSLIITIVQEGIIETKSESFSIKTPVRIDSVSVSILPISLPNKLKVIIDPKNLILEENESNNSYEFNFKEILNINKKDLEKPLILTLIDNKEPYDNIIVSTNPELDIILKDNKPLKLKNNNIIILIKKCENCKYEILQSKDVSSISSSPDSSTIRSVLTLKNLNPGKYSILIIGIDDSGNSNVENPYQINFLITEPGVLLENNLNIYPNPANSCINFEMSEFNSEENGNVSISIFSADGKLIDELTEVLKPGKNSIKWCSKFKGNFVYRMQINSNSEKTSKLFSGKIIIMD